MKLFNGRDIFLVGIFPAQARSGAKVINRSSHGCHAYFVIAPISN